MHFMHGYTSDREKYAIRRNSVDSSNPRTADGLNDDECRQMATEDGRLVALLDDLDPRRMRQLDWS